MREGDFFFADFLNTSKNRHYKMRAKRLNRKRVHQPC